MKRIPSKLEQQQRPSTTRGERKEHTEPKRYQESSGGLSSSSAGGTSGRRSVDANGASASGTTYRKLSGWSFGDASQAYNLPSRPISRGQFSIVF